MQKGLQTSGLWGFWGTMGGWSGAVSADPQQTVLLTLQQSLRSILKLLCQRLCGQRPQQAPTGSLPQVTSMVNDRGRTRSQVEGQARKREVREIGVGRRGCVPALIGSHYLPKAPFPHPQLDAGPRWGRLLLRTLGPDRT